MRVGAAGAAVAAATLVRTIGAGLGVAAVLWLLSGRRYRDSALFCAAGAVVYAPYALWAALHSGGTAGYGTWFAAGFTVRTPFANAATLVVDSLPAVLFPLFRTASVPTVLSRAYLAWVPALAGVLVTGAALAGGARLLARRSIVPLYLAVYLGIVLLWPWEPSRFLVPISPLLFGLVAAGLAGLGRVLNDAVASWTTRLSTPARFAYFLPRAAAVFLLLASLSADAVRLRNVWLEGHWGGRRAAAGWQTMQESFAWLRGHTAPQDVVVSSWPYGTYLFADCKTVFVPPEADFGHALATYRARYVLATERHNAITDEEFGVAPVRRYMEQAPGALRLVWTSTDRQIRIFQVV